MNQNELNVVIVGVGYVGLTTGVCLAYLGHKVTCVDINKEVIAKLKGCEATIHEPGIDELLREVKSNLQFTNNLPEALSGAAVVIIAVGTPSQSNGDADMSAVETVADELGAAITDKANLVIINKSTVPIGSARRVHEVIRSQVQKRGIDCTFCVASNPEFLREGAAISDTLYPDRIVVGAENLEATDTIHQLYLPILEQTFTPPLATPRPDDYEIPDFICTKPTSAELIKYAANSFLATKISFINEFAGLVERVGADIKEVARGIGTDKRIGSRYLEAGLGWGGSCFGKDTSAIVYTAAQYGYDMALLRSAIEVNRSQRLSIIEKLQSSLKVIRGCTVGVLGLAFKPDTDDLRDAPSVDVVKKLLEHSATVKVYDPVAMPTFQAQFSDWDVEYCNGTEDAARGCDALVLVTEWPEFVSLDWGAIAKVMRQRIIVDGRNILDCEEIEQAGFYYQGVGR